VVLAFTYRRNDSLYVSKNFELKKMIEFTISKLPLGLGLSCAQLQAFRAVLEEYVR
jgi:hypothetical protein